MGVPICNQTCTLLENNPHMVKNLWGQIFGLDIGMTACIVYDCREGRGEIYREYTECYSIYVANSKHVQARTQGGFGGVGRTPPLNQEFRSKKLYCAQAQTRALAQCAIIHVDRPPVQRDGATRAKG